MIDSHHHFWKFDEREFEWVTPGMAALRADFGPEQLRAVCHRSGVDGAVSIQARRSTSETEFLLEHAEQHDFLLGVVGWVDLTAPDVAASLGRFSEDDKFVGVREICQGAPDNAYFENAAFQHGVAQLAASGLTYDILVFSDQLPAATALVDRYPEQRFVLDHCAKPPISRGEFAAEWARDIRSLGRRENASCKISGLITEVRDPGGEWDVELLRPYFDVVLEAFGPSRLMFGSDWPVSLLRSSYGQWVEACRSLTASLSAAERDEIHFGAARHFYRLGETRRPS
jgi:L-fuconolactonase